MTKNEYNGHFNYETWLACLWIDNDQGQQEYWAEQAADCHKWAKDRGVGLTKDEQAAVDLAHALKEHFEENSPTAESGFYADLLNAALSEVNWDEIAASMIEEVVAESV